LGNLGYEHPLPCWSKQPPEKKKIVQSEDILVHVVYAEKKGKNFE